MGALAVLVPAVGQVSETFIERHVNRLHDQVVVVTRRLDPAWRTEHPVLLLDPTPPTAAGNLRVRRIAQGVTRVRRGPGLWRPSAEARRSLRSFLEDHGVEAVLGEYLDHWWPLLDAIDADGRRVVMHAHGYDASRLLTDPRWCHRYRRYAEVHAVVAVSGGMRDRLAAVGIPSDKLHVVPYGVDVPSDPPPDRIDEPPVRCLAVGRLVAKKAPLPLLAAFAAASEVCPELRLDVIGDGPLRDALRAGVARAGLEDVVRLHGALPADCVAAIRAESHLFLQHSVTAPDGDQEGLPVAILEAMASGLPVISTRHAGIPDAVVDGETGHLVDEHDVDGMARHIAALGSDAGRRRAMGRAGWQRAREHYAWERERHGLLGLIGL